MKRIILVILISICFCSCGTKKHDPLYDVTIENVITNQYPEGDDFSGFIMYDIRITNRSDSLLVFHVVDGESENDIFILYKNKKLGVFACFWESDSMGLEPYNFVVRRFIFMGTEIYEKQYSKQFSTYREFSKDFAANAELYFISNWNDTIIVKNDKPLIFRGIPGLEEEGWILFDPIREGKIPHP